MFPQPFAAAETGIYRLWRLYLSKSHVCDRHCRSANTLHLVRDFESFWRRHGGFVPKEKNLATERYRLFASDFGMDRAFVNDLSWYHRSSPGNLS